MSNSDNYEAATQDASTDVASFEENHKGLVGKFHDLLHTTPALVPLIVLVSAIILFTGMGAALYGVFGCTSTE